jgi:hypothetical protein
MTWWWPRRKPDRQALTVLVGLYVDASAERMSEFLT